MPFDGQDFKLKVRPLQTGLAGLAQLSDALRWSMPHNFRWDFGHLLEKEAGHCGSYGCAIGLAHVLWPKEVPSSTYVHLAAFLGLPCDDMCPIFGCASGPWPYEGIRFDDVTPPPRILEPHAVLYAATVKDQEGRPRCRYG